MGTRLGRQPVLAVPPGGVVLPLGVACAAEAAGTRRPGVSELIPVVLAPDLADPPPVEPLLRCLPVVLLGPGGTRPTRLSGDFAKDSLIVDEVVADQKVRIGPTRGGEHLWEHMAPDNVEAGQRVPGETAADLRVDIIPRSAGLVVKPAVDRTELVGKIPLDILGHRYGPMPRLVSLIVEGGEPSAECRARLAVRIVAFEDVACRPAALNDRPSQKLGRQRINPPLLMM